MSSNILITCPPMLGMKEQFIPRMEAKGVAAHCPDVIQTLSEEELMGLLPQYDGWIIGDDPATRRVFEAGHRGKLRAAVKWGIGVDNVDFAACEELGIPIVNTPDMFGDEVADIAIGYLVGLARETFLIDREIRAGQWPKHRGISLAGKRVGLVGFGNIGKSTWRRLQAAGMYVTCYDPAFAASSGKDMPDFSNWPDGIDQCDFLLFTCSLNEANRHMLDEPILSTCKPGVRIINVARGPLIDEKALIAALQSGHVYSVALDVFEDEPLPAGSPLRELQRCIFGSHNGSNTSDAVARTNDRAIDELFSMLSIN